MTRQGLRRLLSVTPATTKKFAICFGVYFLESFLKHVCKLQVKTNDELVRYNMTFSDTYPREYEKQLQGFKLDFLNGQ